MRPRILIVEDHPLVAQGLRALLSHSCDVVDIVQDSRRVPSALKDVRPDLVLLDLSMPHRNGIQLLPVMLKLQPDLKVLVVTMHLDRGLADMAFQAGALGFIPKEASADELRGAIAAVLRGERYLSPRVPKRSYRSIGILDEPALERLTPRQREILVLIGEGKSSAEIAEELDLSPRTVEFHRAGIRQALGLSTKEEMVRFAIVTGLQRDPDES